MPELREAQFAAYVDDLKNDSARRTELLDLLREDNASYDQRGTAATIRMRGWVLLAFKDGALPEEALLFVLEELDNGRDAYLVAAAAHVIRNAAPTAAMAPFLLRAITNMRDHDDRVCLSTYGGYDLTGSGTTATKESLASLRWLGANARAVLPDLEAMHVSSLLREEVEQTISAIRNSGGAAREEDCCTWLNRLGSFRLWRTPDRSLETLFEDQNGVTIRFEEFFLGRPSIVVFFYSRCGNPRKCSLSVANLARVQQLLRDRGLDAQIRTAAITYDPEFDLPDRMRGYGQSRGLRLDGDHRMLRSTTGMGALREHFHLGVNFIESLVNRHRVEVYVLNASGQITASFERIQWDERAIVDRAAALLDAPASEPHGREIATPALAVLAAFFPKCPMCWGAYLSVFGVTTLQPFAYSSWLYAALIALMLINLTSVWVRARSRGRWLGFYFAAAGAIATLALGPLDVPFAKAGGVSLTIVGSLLGVWLKPTEPSHNPGLPLSSPARLL